MKRNYPAGTVDGAEQGILGLAVWQARTAAELETRKPQEGEKQPNDGAEDSDSMPQLEDLCLELLLLAAEDVEGDNLWWLRTNPSRCGGARNSESSGEGNVTGLMDELAKPVVVPARGPSIEHGGASWRRCLVGQPMLFVDTSLQKVQVWLVNSTGILGSHPCNWP